MKDFLRRRGPTAIAVALAFVAGGAGVTTAQNLITSADIKDGAVKTADLGKGAVNSPKIADGQVKTADLGKGAVKSPKIADGQVKSADLANGGVNSAKIANGGVANADLANNAVNSAKIANGGVANADLANNAVNSAKVADNTISCERRHSLNGDDRRSATSAPAAQTALTAIYSGPNWGVIDRNVISNGDSYLRAGPAHGRDPARSRLCRLRRSASEASASVPGCTCHRRPERRQGGVRQPGRLRRHARLRPHGRELLRVHDRGEHRHRARPTCRTSRSRSAPNLDAVLGPATSRRWCTSRPPDCQRSGSSTTRSADPIAHWRLTGAEGDETGCNQVTACTFADLMDYRWTTAASSRPSSARSRSRRVGTSPSPVRSTPCRSTTPSTTSSPTGSSQRHGAVVTSSSGLCHRFSPLSTDAVTQTPSRYGAFVPDPAEQRRAHVFLVHVGGGAAGAGVGGEVVLGVGRQQDDRRLGVSRRGCGGWPRCR